MSMSPKDYGDKPCEGLIVDKNLAMLVMETIPGIMKAVWDSDPTGVRLVALSMILIPFNHNQELRLAEDLFNEERSKDIIREKLLKKYIPFAKLSVAEIIDWNVFTADEIIEIACNDEGLLRYVIERSFINSETALCVANKMKSVAIWVSVILSHQLPEDPEACLELGMLYKRHLEGDDSAQDELDDMLKDYAIPYDDFINLADPDNREHVIAAIEFLDSSAEDTTHPIHTLMHKEKSLDKRTRALN